MLQETKGIGNLLYIDQHILNDNKAMDKNIAMAWIDCKNAYDMILQTWVKECLKIWKISEKVMKSITKTMKNWILELAARGKTLAEVKIHWGMFQGDALSSLLIVIAMIPLN